MDLSDFSLSFVKRKEKKVGQLYKYAAEGKQQVVIHEGERHWHRSSISPLTHNTDCKIMLHLREKKERDRNEFLSSDAFVYIYTKQERRHHYAVGGSAPLRNFRGKALLPKQ